MKKYLGSAFALVTLVAVTHAQAAVIVIDDFTDNTAWVVGPVGLGGSSTATQTAANVSGTIIGGTRKVTVSHVGGTGSVVEFRSSGGLAELNSGVSAKGKWDFVWDNGGTGLGSLDLTSGGNNTLLRIDGGGDNGTVVTVKFTDESGDTGSFTQNFNTNLAFSSLPYLFSNAAFSTIDFTDIKSIQVSVVGDIANDAYFNIIVTDDKSNRVPEPGSIAMLVGLGVAGTAFGIRRRK